MHYACLCFYPGEEETWFEEEYWGESEKRGTGFGELPEEDWLMRCLKDGDLVRLLKWTWHSKTCLLVQSGPWTPSGSLISQVEENLL